MKEYDITIIGSGPGGYTAAIRSSQLGFKTAIIEKDRLGGVCLNWGCIPTKALLRSAEIMEELKNLKSFGLSAENISFDFQKIIERSRNVASASEKGVNFLMKKNKIEVINGCASFDSDKSIIISDNEGNETERIVSKHIIIATGAGPRKLPGMKFDEQIILSSTGAMLLKHPPSKLVIVGSGAIGMEFAYFYNAFGTEVIVIEMLPTVLPVEDKEISDVVSKEFKKHGIKIHTGTKTEKVEIKKGRAYTTVSGNLNETLESDAVLIAVGVKANMNELGLEKIGVETYKNGIKTDKDYKTNVDGIYAIGDVALIKPEGKQWLAHVASAEGINCIEKIKGLHKTDIDYLKIPGCIYCHPQVASIGLTESKAKEAGYNIKIGKFPFSANGKARAMGETAGMVKLIFDEKYGELLGAHIVGPEATEIISEITIAVNMEATGESIIKSIHAHPTLHEAILESAGVALGEAINI